MVWLVAIAVIVLAMFAGLLWFAALTAVSRHARPTITLLILLGLPSLVSAESIVITTGPQALDVQDEVLTEYAVAAHGKHLLYRGPEKSNGPWKIDHAGQYIRFLPIDANATAITKGKGLVRKPLQWQDVDVQHAVNDGLVRVILTIKSADAPTVYTWRVDASVPLTLNPDGSVNIGEDMEIQAPWAVDANGDSVDVTVALSGPEQGFYIYTKTIQHTGAAYPVTADPSVEITPVGARGSHTWEIRNDVGNWSAARGATTGWGFSSFYGPFTIGGRTDFDGDTRFDLLRSKSTWLTAGIPAGVTFISAIVRLYDASVVGVDSGSSFFPIATTVDTMLTNNAHKFTAWQSGTTAYSGIIKLSNTYAHMDDFSANDSASFVLNTAGLDSLQAAYDGGRKFAMDWISAKHDSSGVSPVAAGTYGWYITFDNVAGDKPPKLIITYSVDSAPPSGPSLTRSLGTPIHEFRPITGERNQGRVINRARRNP